MLEDPTLATLALCGAVMAVAGLVHGTLGLGFPLVATSLLAFGMDLRAAILMTLLPTVAVNIVSIFHGGGWRQNIRTYWPLPLYALVGSAAGTYVLTLSDPEPFKILLAALIFVYLGSSHLGTLELSWVKDHRGLSMLLFGLVAGISSGTTNVMVPALIVYALTLGVRGTTMVQIFNLCFLAGKLAQITVFAGAGLFDLETAGATLPLAGIALAALFLGLRIRGRIPTEAYTRVVRGVLLALGLFLVGQYFFDDERPRDDAGRAEVSTRRSGEHLVIVVQQP